MTRSMVPLTFCREWSAPRPLSPQDILNTQTRIPMSKGWEDGSVGKKALCKPEDPSSDPSVVIICTSKLSTAREHSTVRITGIYSPPVWLNKFQVQ